MKFHILGVAHSIANSQYPTDPFTNKSVLMAEMLFDRGHDVIYYGVEGGKVRCTKFETVVSTNTFHLAYETKDDTRKQHFSTADGVAWEEFFKNARIAVKNNIQEENKEFLLCFFGHHHAPIGKDLPIISVEPGIGYEGIFAEYKVFESYAWMHYLYGNSNTMWPHSYDAVIPNFYDVDKHVYSDTKDDYLMFMGRVIWGKGISLAVEVANYCNKKLIICGSGDIDKAIPEQISKKNIEYLGVVNFEEKTKLLSKASAFICPSLYVEPFGHVVPEASLAGTPVISTDFGAFTETVRHGITGFRCKVFKDYINAVTALSDIMPANCRKFAVENFSIQAVYPKYYDYFLNIIKLKTTNEGWYSV